MRLASSADTAAARPNIAASRAGWTSSPAHSARRWAAHRAATPRARSKWSYWLRQRSRPYLFSNTLMPAIAGASIKVFDLVKGGDGLRKKLYDNATRFRTEMGKLGFTLAGADHPIIPVMLGDATLAQEMAARMLKRGIYVIGFSFPVVPKGQARIRTQMSAAHSSADIDRAVAAFGAVGKELGVIS
nr:aminotransferase class I/II-fold pyridoxal phosphate-dependent enzyme [Mesorhizobium sp. AR10]